MNLRSRLIRLAYTRPDLRGDLLPLVASVTKDKDAALDGFDFFDGNDENTSVSPVYQAIREIERKLGSSGFQTISPNPLLKPAGASLLADAALRLSDRKAWLVVTKATDKAGALRAGTKVQQNLTAKKSLRASDPYLHDLPLFAVSQNGEWVKIEPAQAKVRERTGPTLTEQKEQLIRQGERFFGDGSIRITGREGEYTLGIAPKLPEHKRLFRTTTVKGSTFEELANLLAGAIEKVQQHESQNHGVFGRS